MSMTKIQELRAKRAKLIQDIRDILEKEEKENRSLTQDELEQIQRMDADIEKLEVQIRNEERAAGLDGVFGGGAQAGGQEQPQQGAGEERTNPRATKEYRDAFEAYIRKSHSGLFPDQVRALNTGSDPEGGYLVPDEYHTQLVEALAEQNVMRGLASTIQTGSGDRLIPLVIDRGEAQWTGESENYPESDAEFGRATLGAHKLARITRVTEELLNDSMFDIEAFLVDSFRRTFGDAEEKAFITGTGTGQPRGFLLDAEVGVTAAAQDSVTTDELLDLYHSLRRPYRSRATWMLNDSTILAIRKLKDANDQYIWQPGLQAGQPDRILGRPVAVSRFMPELGEGNKAIAFGDFSYYWIADRQSIGIQRLVELYAAQGQVGFRMFMRTDGKLILPEAIVTLEGGSASSGGVEG